VRILVEVQEGDDIASCTGRLRIVIILSEHVERVNHRTDKERDGEDDPNWYDLHEDLDESSMTIVFEERLVEELKDNEVQLVG